MKDGESTDAFGNTRYEEVPWREYVDQRFIENQRALDVVAAERDRAAEVLRDEQRRAISVAEVEREKAAAALRAGTDRAISDNYTRLREQLESSEKLLRALIDANGAEFRAIQVAAKDAITKAEEAQQRVNIGQNEFRGSLSDLTSTMLPRREAEATLADHIRQIGELKDGLAEVRQSVAVGPAGLKSLQSGADREAGSKASNENTGKWMLALLTIGVMLFVGMLGTIVTLIVTHA